MPLAMAACLVIGILLGTFYANHFSGNRLNIINTGSNRLTNLLHLISDRYVDKVNIDSLVSKAIPQLPVLTAPGEGPAVDGVLVALHARLVGIVNAGASRQGVL